MDIMLEVGFVCLYWDVEFACTEFLFVISVMESVCVETKAFESVVVGVVMV